jgi:hypothetical protein
MLGPEDAWHQHSWTPKKLHWETEHALSGPPMDGFSAIPRPDSLERSRLYSAMTLESLSSAAIPAKCPASRLITFFGKADTLARCRRVRRVSAVRLNVEALHAAVCPCRLLAGGYVTGSRRRTGSRMKSNSNTIFAPGIRAGFDVREPDANGLRLSRRMSSVHELQVLSARRGRFTLKG